MTKHFVDTAHPTMSKSTGMTKDEICDTKQKLFTDDTPLSLLAKMRSLPNKMGMAPTLHESMPFTNHWCFLHCTSVETSSHMSWLLKDRQQTKRPSSPYWKKMTLQVIVKPQITWILLATQHQQIPRNHHCHCNSKKGHTWVGLHKRQWQICREPRNANWVQIGRIKGHGN